MADVRTLAVRGTRCRGIFLHGGVTDPSSSRHSRVMADSRKRSWTTSASLLLVLLAAACAEERRLGTRDGGSVVLEDAGPIVSDPDAGGCTEDEDGDGIIDGIEGRGDEDLDDVPNYQDLDSDDDGVPDADEIGEGHDGCTSVADCDGDGYSNYIDDDSDNDGLRDGEEAEAGTDPCRIDTDGDGVTDYAEIEGSRTDPTNPTDSIDPGDFFLTLPYEDPPVERTLRFGSRLRRADVYLLVDTTGSMGDTIDNLRASLRDTIVPLIGAEIADVAFGVGTFEDLPFVTLDEESLRPRPHSYGGETDHAYDHLLDVTENVDTVQASLDSMTLGWGGDLPESPLLALYHMATGAAGAWRYQPIPIGRVRIPRRDYAIEARVCPSIPDETQPRTAYPCFRPHSLPIVVLATDAPWHLPEDYRVDPPPPSLEMATEAMVDLGARFVYVGVTPGEPGMDEALAIAEATGSVTADGEPLLYTAEGGEVSRTVVTGIETLTRAVPQDVTTLALNRDGNPDDFDATRFIDSITTVEGYFGGVAGEGYESRDETTFFEVVPGTSLEFRVVFENDVVPEQERPQLFRARILVLGSGGAELDRRNVYIVVPPENGPFLI